MLQLSNTLINRPILSLRTGTSVAMTIAPVINPNNLKIEGFYCTDNLSRSQLILLTQDIRDIVPQGFVVNDYDSLSDQSELVRLKDVLELNFILTGKQVVTVGKRKVGKVNDYAVEMSSMYVQKLYVSQSVFKSFATGSLSVDRSQITEITPSRIVINDLDAKVPAHAGAMA